jgi:maleate isomerase
MYGWKGRIGLLIPARCTAMEPEFYKMAPEGVTTHTTRMVLRASSLSSYLEMEDEIYRAAELIQPLNPDIIVVGCTSGGFVKGKSHDEAMTAKISTMTGIAAISSATAVIEALKVFRIRRVALATPYTEDVNEKEKEFLESHGVQVTRMKGLGYSQPQASYPLAPREVSGMGLLEPYVAYKLAQDVDSREAEGVLISCTNLRTIECIQALEENLRKPVITSNQATMWLALRRMGINERIMGFGSLLTIPALRPSREGSAPPIP